MAPVSITYLQVLLIGLGAERGWAFTHPVSAPAFFEMKTETKTKTRPGIKDLKYAKLSNKVTGRECRIIMTAVGLFPPSKDNLVRIFLEKLNQAEI